MDIRTALRIRSTILGIVAYLPVDTVLFVSSSSTSPDEFHIRALPKSSRRRRDGRAPTSEDPGG
ncbi:hypothetical protein EWM64_g964 [Hericium alpestre]|uniref:Uncharacterized protein n=1 Tax=Hericium alpestre TaxID=135208 RepID=A0A4Z0A9N1_9AGAM|nr:hypothetical protein EWM64_g964 [Hericium alpestre]